MRIRSTKPEFWRSKTIALLPWDVRLVLKGLESYVDDNGVGKDDIALIAADVFPRDLSGNPRETLARLSEAINLLHDGGLVARYEADGEDLLYIDRWKDLQRIDKPANGRFPRPDGTLSYSEVVDRGSYRANRESVASLPEVVAPGTGEQGNRGTGEQTLLLNPDGLSVSAPADNIAAAFDKFYKAYPRHAGKDAAQRKFTTIVKSKKVTPEQIIAGAKRLAADPNLPAKNFIPYPATWLHAGGWADEPLPPRDGQPANQRAAYAGREEYTPPE